MHDNGNVIAAARTGYPRALRELRAMREALRVSITAMRKLVVELGDEGAGDATGTAIYATARALAVLPPEEKP